MLSDRITLLRRCLNEIIADRGHEYYYGGAGAGLRQLAGGGGTELPGQVDVDEDCIGLKLGGGLDRLRAATRIARHFYVPGAG